MEYKPAPRFMFVDRLDGCANERAQCDTNDGGEAEQRHRDTSSFVPFPDVADGTTDKIDTNAGGSPTEESY